jgi:undecaprenyl-diphosphatase
MTGGFVLDGVLKLVFHRARPPSHFGTPEPASHSFPSGHALFSACLWARSRFSPGSAVLLAGLIGHSRLHLGMHYPSDVIAGYAAATVRVATVGYTNGLIGPAWRMPA